MSPKIRKVVLGAVALTFIAFLFISKGRSKDTSGSEEMLTAVAQRRSFAVHVNTVGELEAARSQVIASSLRGDMGKVIYLVNDGVTVNAGDILVKMDPTPFEEKVAELRSKIQDQNGQIAAFIQTLNWERNQSALEEKTAAFEVETAELELAKTIHGDGPLELQRLRNAMMKSKVKYEELLAYNAALDSMEKDGYLSKAERCQAEKKLQEEKEAFESANLQYETYSNHVFPMQVKKAESALKRQQLRCDDICKTGRYKVGKALANLRQARQTKRELLAQYRMAQQELEMSEIKAQAPGMVVLREDYRSGQKRKPRVGDILVKNQPILDLPDLDSMVVKTRVREVDLYKVGLGKNALVEVDAYPRVFFKGKVQAIGVLALTDMMRGNEKFFEVKVALEGGDRRLRPGMTARVTILADQVDDKLSVPLHAIFDIDRQPHCYVKDGNGFRLQKVTSGCANAQWIEVVEGLAEGDVVSLAPPQ